MDSLMAKIEDQIESSPLDYEDSKQQFIEATQELGLKHTFTFDEAWGAAQELRRRNTRRAEMMEFQKRLEQNENSAKTPEELEVHNPLKHSFADGMYVREIVNAAGQIIVTKIHKQKHPFFLMSGEMSILTDDGVIKLTGPHYGITEAGTKRVIYTHTECKFVTVHLTDKVDLAEIEEEVIAKDYTDPLLAMQDMNLLREVSA